MILDTTAIIDILRGNEAVKNKISQLDRNNIPISITPISAFEVLQGIEYGIDERKEERILQFLESINSYLFDMPPATEAGKIQSKLRHEGSIIDPEDSMIAGIAKMNNEVILTRNIKHFSRINNLKIETY